ncbi:MAG: hypothetical protein JWM11_2000 [Planctomycetaceae bacterium]|nr:hypothetical protein [Planctomycetaceae bacterium]
MIQTNDLRRSSFKWVLVFLALCGREVPTSYGADDSSIATMDELKFTAPKEKGRVELVDGQMGKAVQFSFDKDGSGKFATSNIRGTPAWDQAAGFSFWVKGDGSDAWGGLEVIYDDDYAVRYDYMFPIKSKQWTKVVVAWQDLIPVLPGPKARTLNPSGENRPSKLSGLWFGKWWYWSEYPAHSFVIDEIRLETDIPRDATDYTSSHPPLQRVLEKLKSGRPVTIVTLGDSLTDFRHWANRTVSWPNLLRDELHQKYKSEVTIVNRAIGGTQLTQNLVLMPRWLERSPNPDLVLICFGGNDWDAGMRGPMFLEANLDAIDRVRRATKGKADVLLMSTIPSATRWDVTAELSEACRKATVTAKSGLADTEKAFLDAGKSDKNRLFVDDRVHLSPAGHKLVVKTILQAIEDASR